MKATTKSKTEITRENLRVVCGLNGLRIVDLANTLGYARETMYYAVRWPDRYPIAYRKICEALPIRPPKGASK